MMIDLTWTGLELWLSTNSMTCQKSEEEYFLDSMS